MQQEYKKHTQCLTCGGAFSPGKSGLKQIHCGKCAKLLYLQMIRELYYDDRVSCQRRFPFKEASDDELLGFAQFAPSLRNGCEHKSCIGGIYFAVALYFGSEKKIFLNPFLSHAEYLRKYFDVTNHTCAECDFFDYVAIDPEAKERAEKVKKIRAYIKQKEQMGMIKSTSTSSQTGLIFGAVSFGTANKTTMRALSTSPVSSPVSSPNNK